MQIDTSKQEQSIIEIQQTLGSVCNTEPITLGYTSSAGFAEHYDACRKCTTEESMHGIEHHPQNKNVQEASVDPGCCVDLKNQTAIAHEIIIYYNVTEPKADIPDGRNDERDINITVAPEFIAQPLVSIEDIEESQMNVEPIERTAPDCDIHKDIPSINCNVTQHPQALTLQNLVKFVTHQCQKETGLAYRKGRKPIEGVESEKRHLKIGIKM